MGLFRTTKTNTVQSTNTTENYDQRSVWDAAGGLAGSDNFWDQSNYDARAYTDASQSFTDNSDRRVDASQRFTDNSDRRVDSSQRFTDSSDRSVRVSDSRDLSQRFTDSSDRSVRIDARTSTDGGAFDIVRQLGDGVAQTMRMQSTYARDIAMAGAGTANEAFAFAQDAQEGAASFSSAQLGRAFDLARTSQAMAFESSGAALNSMRETFSDALALASETIGQAGRQASEAADTASGAYSAAADTSSGNKTVVYVGLAVVGLAVAAWALRRG